MGAGFSLEMRLREMRGGRLQTWSATSGADADEACARTAAALLLSPEAVRELVGLDGTTVDVLRARDSYMAPPNCLQPALHFPRFPLGTVSIQSFVGNPEDAYVQILTSMPASEVHPTEPEGDIRNSETYKAYLRMRSEGHEPPYITLFEVESRSCFASRIYTTSNRRRTLVAQELGLDVTGWRQPLMQDTGLPMKLADVNRTYCRMTQMLADYDCMSRVPRHGERRCR